jgi:hypothetical protein
VAIIAISLDTLSTTLAERLEWWIEWIELLLDFSLLDFAFLMLLMLCIHGSISRWRGIALAN